MLTTKIAPPGLAKIGRAVFTEVVRSGANVETDVTSAPMAYLSFVEVAVIVAASSRPARVRAT